MLSGEAFVSRLILKQTIGSTNDELRRLAVAGAAEGTVVIAGAQTAGRGRLGRRWHSAPGRGLYLSVLLHPAEPLSRMTRWTLAAAVAACRACREVSGCAVEIEWPNDLSLSGRKVAGILAEVRASDRRRDLVLGSGFNVLHAVHDFPAELAQDATSLRIASGRDDLDRERLAAVYLRELARTVVRMRAGAWTQIAAEWTGLAPGACGRRVRVRPPDAATRPWEGVTAGIDDDGALVVQRPDGGTASIRMVDAVVPLEV